ncbi:MAG: hypothetical protein ACQEQE_07305 [Bacillota bacterium]
MKIALGLVVRSLNKKVNILKFLKNAKKFNHKIDEVIIAYSENYDKDMANKIKKFSKLKLLKINHNHKLCYRLKELGMEKKNIKELLYSEKYEKYGLIPYGKNRNNVLVQAIIDNMDILFFVDDDVKPSILVKQHGKIKELKIDFFKRHLEYLKDNVYVTSSDYSGYYIVPPMNFDNMEHLIRGLQKGALFKKSFVNEPGYLTVNKLNKRQVSKTDKVLGGNLALRLEIFKDILPFFSGTYRVKGDCFLTRGEDTLLGLTIKDVKNKHFLDIDLKIFHDTFSDFPKPPDILHDEDVKDRFFYACMGWIGRNSFLNWILNRDLQKYYTRTRKALRIGAPAIAKYLDDERFLILPEALNASYKNLDNMLIDYYKLRNNWEIFIDKQKNI